MKGISAGLAMFGNPSFSVTHPQADKDSQVNILAQKILASTQSITYATSISSAMPV